MKSTAEVKFVGDGYAGFYSCGLTMQDSDTFRDFKIVSETEEETLYRNSKGIELKVSHIEDVNLKITRIVTSITNNSDEAVTMEMLTSFMIKGIKADKIIRLTSFWSAEGRIKTDTIADLNLEQSWNHMAFRVEKFGNVGSMPVRRYFPFVAAVDSDSNTTTAVSLYTPASWQMEVTVRHDDSIALSGGIADRDFGAWTKKLNPGETFVAPMALATVAASFDEACDRLVNAQKPDISPVDDHMGITFNEYCTTWGNPTSDNIKKIADRLEGKGIQYLVMDSGWYGVDGYEGYWFQNTGDWHVNKAKFPKGLKDMTDYIRAKGMIPGIWFEFEVVTPQCELYNCPEHLVCKDGVPLTVGERRYLDMEDPWVIDHLKKSVIDLLKKSGFGYIKVDYNDSLGLGVDGEDGLGENLRRKLLGTQNFFRLMKEEIPDLVIENCSSGGHRLEPSFMELASQASFSDAHEILSLPIIAANMHRVVKPSQAQIWSVMRKDDTDNRIYYSMCATMMGRMGLSGDIYDLSDHQWQLVDEAMDYYRFVSPIIEKGSTLINFTDTPSYNKPQGGQLLVRYFEDKALLVYHRFENSVSMEEFISKNNIDLGEFNVIRSYGEAMDDFSAQSLAISK